MLILILGSKISFPDDFGHYDTITIIFRLFCQMPLKIELPWQHPRSQVIKTFLKGVLYVESLSFP